MGNSTITIGTHDIGYNPDVNSATVLSLTMPTPEECGALSPLPTPDADQGTQVQAADSSTWTALAQPVDTSRRKLEEGRQLWGAATASTSSELWWAANGAYGGGSSTGTFTPWCSCVNGNARAQFFYKCDNRGCNMNLGFAGSDDTKDWLQNFQFLPGGASVHNAASNSSVVSNVKNAPAFRSSQVPVASTTAASTTTTLSWSLASPTIVKCCQTGVSR